MTQFYTKPDSRLPTSSSCFAELFESIGGDGGHLAQYSSVRMGARALSQLARVDAEDKFTAIFDKHFAPIRGPVMITAAHIIQGGARSAAAKPHLADRIAAEVLKVDRGR